MTRVPVGAAHEAEAINTELDSLARLHMPGLVALAYTVSGSRNEAEDIVQSVLARFAGRDLAEISDLPAYARRAVCNEAKSLGRRWRLGRARAQALTAEWERELRGQPDPFGRVEVLSALHTLPVRQRTAIVLRYYLDLTDQQIADALDCAPATVRSLLSRGTKALRSQLEDQS